MSKDLSSIPPAPEASSCKETAAALDPWPYLAKRNRDPLRAHGWHLSHPSSCGYAWPLVGGKWSQRRHGHDSKHATFPGSHVIEVKLRTSSLVSLKHGTLPRIMEADRVFEDYCVFGKAPLLTSMIIGKLLEGG